MLDKMGGVVDYVIDKGNLNVNREYRREGGEGRGGEVKAYLVPGQCFVSQWSMLRLNNSKFKSSRQPSAFTHNRGNH